MRQPSKSVMFDLRALNKGSLQPKLHECAHVCACFSVLSVVLLV